MKALALAAALAISTTAVVAHELGTTHVTATFHRDHTYSIDVTTAPLPLLHKLEVQRGLPRSPSVTREQLQSFAADYADGVEITFGAERVTPRVEMLSVDAHPTLRLTGAIPKSATTFRWRSEWNYATYLIDLRNEGESDVRQWLDGDATSEPFPLSAAVIPPTRAQVAHQYLVLGFTHILPYGLDHILFVLGLFLLAAKWKPVFAQVTAFTIAHTITLGLTIAGVLSISPKFVEPLIALSIVYIGVENLTTTRLRPWRIVLVFAFGLLHGMGFAGVLRELGIPRGELATALLSFNVGVELGQLAVIALAFVLVAQWHRAKPWYRYRFVVPASAAIACVGVFWTVQRLM